MVLNKNKAIIILLYALSVLLVTDVQGYFVQAAIKPTPGIKTSPSFYVVSSIEPVENYGSSPSYQTSGTVTYGTGETPTPPVTPTPTPTTTSGGQPSGGRGKYDASNWLLERKYNELASAGDFIGDEDEGYTSAPKSDREPLSPFPVDEFEPTPEEVEPVVQPPTEKDLQANIFEPEEESTEEVPAETNIFDAQSFEEAAPTISTEIELALPEWMADIPFVELPEMEFVDIESPLADTRMFPLYPETQQRVVFTEDCESKTMVAVACDCFCSFLFWIWLLIVLIVINVILLFWQLMIVDRFIREKENPEQKVVAFFKNLWQKVKNLFIQKK
ncbi:hypothetical protein HC823_00660 [Candidatus Gracilibacteria bacterium]|nr:hypothetical protein [Candidatus Gracilibacteria bacterium]